MFRNRSIAVALTTLLAVVAASGCVVQVGASPAAEHAERILETSIEVAAGDRLQIRNLAGVATLGRTDGDRVTVRAVVRAGGDDQAEAEALAERIELREGSEDGDATLTVAYPVDDYGSFHYEGQHDSGIASWFGGSNTRLEYMGRRVRVSTSRAAGAATVSADLEIGVPAGVDIHLLNAIGRAHADGVEGDLTLVVHSGAIRAGGGRGRLSADTGSGSVDVSEHEGSVVVDTGSGGVDVVGVRGEVRVDTGSGSVRVERVEGPFVRVDTGSGGVRLVEVAAAIDVDTGSGSVEGTGLRLGERLRVDTGSGRIRLAGDFAQLRDADLGTGSGGVTLRMSAYPAMRLDLRTGSGGIDVDLPDVRSERSDRNSFRGQVGEGDGAEIVVSTSSGGIRISTD